MRFGVVFLIAISCTGCAAFQKPAAQASAPQQAAAQQNPAPVADAGPAKFECSDGTISSSQDACLVSMARARLPPGQTIGRMPANPAPTANDPPTGAVR
jgi:hypothetical protein